jgi:hypothetical protein
MTHAEKRAEQEFPIIRLDYLEDLNEPERTAYIKGWEADKWVSVEDELPKKRPGHSHSNDVNILAEWAIGGLSVSTGAYDYIQYKWTDYLYGESVMPYKIIAWQPLPEPPKTK